MSGNDVLHLKNEDVYWVGALDMSGNSVLILDNAAIYNSDRNRRQNCYSSLRDNAKIILQNNSTIDHFMWGLALYDDASIFITDSTLKLGLILGSNGTSAHIVNSNLVSASSDVGGDFLMVNSTVMSLTFQGSSARIVNSRIENGLTVSSSDYPVCVDLVNSTYGMPINEAYTVEYFRQGVICVYWFLGVEVVSDVGVSLSGVDVQIYSSDGALVAQQTTSKNGNTQFELLTLEISKHGETFHGNYIIKVTCDQTQIQETINLETSTQKTITIQK
ncbi:MAG: hypothetical protein FWD52_02025 [Candidatus Bathyarchaeota archaeon]|nr:hypothetical protein [Candidatus Termiticorpusculum sp.]